MPINTFVRGSKGERIVVEVSTSEELDNLSRDVQSTTDLLSEDVGRIKGDLDSITIDLPYEKCVIWAEESGGVADNNSQYSFGNGATGNIGIPLIENWEAYGFSFQADVSSDGARVSIDLMDYSTETPTSLTTVETTNQGTTNNYRYITTFKTPILLKTGTVVGFKTNDEVGSISDARCAVWIRRRPGF